MEILGVVYGVTIYIDTNREQPRLPNASEQDLHGLFQLNLVNQDT